MRVEERPPPPPARRAPERRRNRETRPWAQPWLVRLRLTVVPVLRRGARVVARTVQRTEDALVPALMSSARRTWHTSLAIVSALARGLLGFTHRAPGAVGRAEGRLVGVLTGIAGGAAGGIGRAEHQLVLGLTALAELTVRTGTRGLEGLADGLTRGGRRSVQALQQLEERTPTTVAPRTRPLAPGEREFVPPPTLLRRPAPRRAVRRARLQSAGLNLVGLALTAALVVLSLVVAGGRALPEAARKSSAAVDVTLRLPPDPTLQPLGERSYIYAASGLELQVLDREENRRIVELAQIPPVIQQAILTAEDQRFYEHNGYDPGGIGRALVANIEAGEVTQGGSTITQQLAKSAVGDDVTVWRKAEELAYAVALEQRFSKSELLNQYLNQVYFGENAYGVAAAAEEYFGITDVAQLRAEHGALLGAMIRSPNSANPRTDPEVATRRRNIILDQMVPQGFITQAEADAAKALPLGVVPETSRERPYEFIADSVRREFLSAPEFAQFGATLEEREHALYSQGLRIYSSLDTRLQDIAQDVVGRTFPASNDPEQPTGALVTVEPATGRILAAHSGLAYDVNQQAIPTQGRRQLGSAAKPFVYAEALRQGFPPSIRLNGASPAYYENCPGWERRRGGVQNFGGANREIMDMPTALRDSVNTTAVQMSQMIGIDRMVAIMGEMGVDTQAATGGQANCALALGGFANGVTPLEAASAYATFANGGVHVKPHFIDAIDDRHGNRLYAAQPAAQTVLSPEANALMVQMMQGVVTGGTGTRAQLPGWPVAGKTGTTTDQKDAWFVGYTPNLSTAMWVGVPKKGRPLNTTGAGLPTSVWQQYMAAVLAGQPPIGFPAVGVGQGRVAAAAPVTVPGVLGLGVQDALAALSGARLGGETRPVPNPAPAGTVVGQSLPPGTGAVSGDNVLLDVSTGGAPPPPPPPPPT